MTPSQPLRRLSRLGVAGVVAWLLAALVGSPALAQSPPAAPVGLWQCTVNGPTYGLELQMQVAPDRTLFARGQVIYYGLQNPFTAVEGPGDWTLLPPDQTSPDYTFAFRMIPQAGNHPIVSWYARPAGPGILYNLFYPPTGGTVETQCSKIG